MQQLITACAFVHHKINGEDKVLLMKRSDNSPFLPGVWELPGGHIEPGEDIVDGLRRELREECKLECRVGDPFACFTYYNQAKNSDSVEVIYFATFTDQIENLMINPEHSEYGWYGAGELDQILIGKDSDDPELKAIRRGFSLLSSHSLNLG